MKPLKCIFHGPVGQSVKLNKNSKIRKPSQRWRSIFLLPAFPTQCHGANHSCCHTLAAMLHSPMNHNPGPKKKKAPLPHLGCCSHLVSIAMLKTGRPTQEGRSLLYPVGHSLLQRKVQARIETETWSSCCLLLAAYELLGLLPYKSQDHLCRHGTAHSGLGPSSPVVIHENSHGLAYRPV